jgi:hypothetical protein
MCNEHDNSDSSRPDDTRTGISRRNFTGLAFAGTALSLIPMRTWAAQGGLKALCIMCIDYRLVNTAIKFFDGKVGVKEYDLVALAGASLAGVGPAFPASNAAFWDHIGIAKSLHDIQKVLILDHRDCGAYKVQYGTLYQGSGAGELEQHQQIMKLVKAESERRKVGLPFEFYLMPADGGPVVQVPV